MTSMIYSMDWFKGRFAGKPHIEWENLWFPVEFPLNQSIYLPDLGYVGLKKFAQNARLSLQHKVPIPP